MERGAWLCCCVCTHLAVLAELWLVRRKTGRRGGFLTHPTSNRAKLRPGTDWLLVFWMVFPLSRNKLTGKFLLSCGSGIKTSEIHIFTPLSLTWPFFEILCLDPSCIYIEDIVYDFLLPISHYNHPPSFSWVTPNCPERGLRNCRKTGEEETEVCGFGSHQPFQFYWVCERF